MLDNSIRCYAAIVNTLNKNRSGSAKEQDSDTNGIFHLNIGTEAPELLQEVKQIIVQDFINKFDSDNGRHPTSVELVDFGIEVHQLIICEVNRLANQTPVETRNTIVELRKSNVPVAKICEQTGVSKSTVYDILKKHSEGPLGH